MGCVSINISARPITSRVVLVVSAITCQPKRHGRRLLRRVACSKGETDHLSIAKRRAMRRVSTWMNTHSLYVRVHVYPHISSRAYRASGLCESTSDSFLETQIKSILVNRIKAPQPSHPNTSRFQEDATRCPNLWGIQPVQLGIRCHFSLVDAWYSLAP